MQQAIKSTAMPEVSCACAFSINAIGISVWIRAQIRAGRANASDTGLLTRVAAECLSFDAIDWPGRTSS